MRLAGHLGAGGSSCLTENWYGRPWRLRGGCRDDDEEAVACGSGRRPARARVCPARCRQTRACRPHRATYDDVADRDCHDRYRTGPRCERLDRSGRFNLGSGRPVSAVHGRVHHVERALRRDHPRRAARSGRPDAEHVLHRHPHPDQYGLRLHPRHLGGKTAVRNVGYVSLLLSQYYPNITTLPRDRLAGHLHRDRPGGRSTGVHLVLLGQLRPCPRRSTARRGRVRIVEFDSCADTADDADATQSPNHPPATTTGPVDTPIGPYTIVTDDVAGATVTVDPTTTSMFSDAAGTVPIANGATVFDGGQIWLRSTAIGAATLTAHATATVPSGNVYIYNGNITGVTDAQNLILAQTQTVEASATADVTFEETTEPHHDHHTTTTTTTTTPNHPTTTSTTRPRTYDDNPRPRRRRRRRPPWRPRPRQRKPAPEVAP